MLAPASRLRREKCCRTARCNIFYVEILVAAAVVRTLLCTDQVVQFAPGMTVWQQAILFGVAALKAGVQLPGA